MIQARTDFRVYFLGVYRVFHLVGALTMEWTAIFKVKTLFATENELISWRENSYIARDLLAYVKIGFL